MTLLLWRSIAAANPAVAHALPCWLCASCLLATRHACSEQHAQQANHLRCHATCLVGNTTGHTKDCARSHMITHDCTGNSVVIMQPEDWAVVEELLSALPVQFS